MSASDPPSPPLHTQSLAPPPPSLRVEGLGGKSSEGLRREIPPSAPKGRRRVPPSLPPSTHPPSLPPPLPASLFVTRPLCPRSRLQGKPWRGAGPHFAGLAESSFRADPRAAAERLEPRQDHEDAPLRLRRKCPEPRLRVSWSGSRPSADVSPPPPLSLFVCVHCQADVSSWP